MILWPWGFVAPKNPLDGHPCLRAIYSDQLNSEQSRNRQNLTYKVKHTIQEYSEVTTQELDMILLGQKATDFLFF